MKYVVWRKGFGIQGMGETIPEACENAGVNPSDCDPAKKFMRGGNYYYAIATNTLEYYYEFMGDSSDPVCRSGFAYHKSRFGRE